MQIEATNHDPSHESFLQGRLSTKAHARKLHPLLARLRGLSLAVLALMLLGIAAGRAGRSDELSSLTALLSNSDGTPCDTCLLGVTPGITRMYEAYMRVSANPDLQNIEPADAQAWSEGVLTVQLGDAFYYGLAQAPGGQVDRFEFGWQPGSSLPSCLPRRSATYCCDSARLTS